MKEGSVSLLRLFLLVLGCVSMAVVVHQGQQQQSGVTTNTNFYPVLHHHHVDNPVHDRDDDDNAVVADSLKDTILTHEMKELFHSWRQEFAIEYKTAKELEERMQVWLQNHVFIETHNNQDPPASYELGHNQFSDLTWDEYKAYNKLGEYSPGIMMDKLVVLVDGNEVGADIATSRRLAGRISAADEPTDVPDSVNWIERGAIPPVKNQGMCGSCWAFSAIGAIEGAHFLDTGNLVALSEQQLVDCDPLDLGCSGGLMDNAFLFDENSTGICSEEDYPYVQHKRWFRGCASAKGLCQPQNHTRVDTFVDVKNTVDALVKAIADQPVSIAIEADQQSFQFYRKGVYSDPKCGNNLDHGVLAVGYGTSTDGKDYFLVRNSWGATWGDKGYIKMARHSKQVNGTCGILSFASRPILREDH
ncbi:C1 peptidase-like protein [Fragilaria crotonensis]|nr:C1 peptidase-like protein [Fragilaria crotonensis]